MAVPASFFAMTEAGLRQWVEANPTRVNDWGWPSYIQDRVARSEPLPRVTLVPVTAGNKRPKKRRKFRSMLGFILGMNGWPKGEGMPCDVFRGVLMDFLMPAWDPLRRKRGNGGQLLQGLGKT